MSSPSILSAGLLATALSVCTLASATPDTARADDCRDLAAHLRGDPLQSKGFSVIAAKELYRIQDRPFAHIPTGAKLLVRAPAGVTEADLHRAARCSAGPSSPLSVPGAALMVRRAGDLYELHITATTRNAALQIRDRALALAR
jgi:hypothetical protein